MDECSQDSDGCNALLSTRCAEYIGDYKASGVQWLWAFDRPGKFDLRMSNEHGEVRSNVICRPATSGKRE
jgi:hypothetical protein